MTARTYARLLAEGARLIRSGRSAIIDATFSRRELRLQWIRRLDRHRIAFHFVEVLSSDRTIKERLLARNRKRGEISDARLEDFAALNGGYEVPTDLSSSKLVRVFTSGSAERTVTRVLKALAMCDQPCA